MDYANLSTVYVIKQIYDRRNDAISTRTYCHNERVKNTKNSRPFRSVPRWITKRGGAFHLPKRIKSLPYCKQERRVRMRKRLPPLATQVVPTIMITIILALITRKPWNSKRPWLIQWSIGCIHVSLLSDARYILALPREPYESRWETAGKDR